MAVVAGQRRFAYVLVVLEVVFMVLFGFFGRFGPGLDPAFRANESDVSHELAPLQGSYAMFTDIHIMIFVGFGFLMTFLRRYGYGAVGLNFLVAAIVVQWSIIMQGLLVNNFSHFHLGITTLIEGDVAAAAVLITFGALLGKVGPLQLVVIALIEIIVYSINYHIGIQWFGAVDAGGSMFVHTFGAYFGLACSKAINEAWHHTHKLNAKAYHSDLFSLIGTIFLWICWPSFNAALVPEYQQYRAVINTYLALAACVVTAFAVSILVSKNSRFEVEHIQNATLAGGVAVGTCADFLINPVGAMMLGSLSGCLSVVGYQYVSNFLSKHLDIHDTCGVHNLHGMPGILAGLAGIVAAGLASSDTHSLELYEIFQARRSQSVHSTKTGDGPLGVEKIGGRSAGEQALAQGATLGVTLLLAIVGGFLTGLLIRWQFCQKMTESEGFDDGVIWEMPDSDSDDDQPVAGTIGNIPPPLAAGNNDTVKPGHNTQTVTQQTTKKTQEMQFKPQQQQQQQSS